MLALGYAEGRDYLLDHRYAQNDLARLPSLAADLVALKVDLMWVIFLYCRGRLAFLWGNVTTNLFAAERSRIISLAQAQRWPLVATARGWAERGALLTYGIDTPANFRRAAWYVDRLLKGTKPGDLPFEQPKNFELVVNLKTAKTLGLTVPPQLLLQASRVIE